MWRFTWRFTRRFLCLFPSPSNFIPVHFFALPPETPQETAHLALWLYSHERSDVTRTRSRGVAGPAALESEIIAMQG